ncbi:hypothetical protein ADK60_37525 [Streptomyces sp. XY431]|uniref:hypothetical protein n=1 Tax=Streptomyces sp. XY431 TaxID=1415562 RepID=UPI0006AED174|nr:hypothetical protein [Streptomyces sp. XY431]KOV10735.1 hypothetical protein ADK60_37525 [Streptomyces sp. XY431]
MTSEEYDAWQAGLEQMHRDYEEADQAEYAAWMDELDARDVARWADPVLDRAATSGALLEQRHVLHEAAHPETVAALQRLALLAPPV